MSSHPNSPAGGTTRLLLGALLAAAMLASAGPTLRAQDAVKTGSALSLVPADTAFFATMLRNKEQMELLYKSNAYKTLRALPLVKEAHEKLMKEIGKDPNNPIAMYHAFVKDKDNKELVDLLLEAVSDEIFVYGGKVWGDFIIAANRVNAAQQWGSLGGLVGGGNPQQAQIRAVLRALQESRDKLRVPELIFGFKLQNPAKAANQMNRLEKILAGLTESVAPMLKGKISRKKAAGGDFVTLEVDGSMLPWENMPIKDYEEKKDEFDDLIAHGKKMTGAVSLGVKDGYLLFGITSSLADFEKLNLTGKSLAGVAEMKPLAGAAGKPLTGIGYVSKAFRDAAAQGSWDLEGTGKSLKDILAKAEQISAERKKAIEKDLDQLIADARKYKPVLGAQVSFDYMTPTGYEGYSYDYSNHDSLKGVSLSLQNHFGGSPIFAAAFAFNPTGEYYANAVKWLKVVYGHAEGALMDVAPQEGKDEYQKFTKAIFPILQRFDDITRKQLLPAMKRSGLGIVLDGKWSSKQWHNQAPAMDKPMPAPELGLLLGITDADGFERAMTDYRKTLNELYEKVRDVVPNKENIPEFKIPAPEREKGANGVLLFYPFPDEAGLDKQFQPTVGIGKNVSVVALSKKHADRLMASTPLTMKSGPLSRKGPLVGVAVLDWPALIDLAAPWVEFGMTTAPIPKEKLNESLEQARVVFKVLKCFKGSTSASYLEDGKLVTHVEKVIKDLDEGPKP
jgi:hypothetical protein